MIQVNHVVKHFDGFCALSDVNMHVSRGSIYGLIGPNGAGKSTIIRHITGVYRPDSGEILVNGESVYENPQIKSQISYIPDDLFYFMQANTLEMKHFYASIYPQFNEALFHRLREFFPAIDIHRSIRRLSKGTQKQVSFWLALCCTPSLMILDEPVDGLDPVMRRQLWGVILGEVSDHGTSLLISSHNLRELEDVCDHVGIMYNGKILVEHSLCDLQGNVSKIQAAFENEMPILPEQFEILHMSNAGRVYTLIVKGNPEEAKKHLSLLNPILIDVLPLTLEEIFIYEMGGAGYAIKDNLF